MKQLAHCRKSISPGGHAEGGPIQGTGQMLGPGPVPRHSTEWEEFVKLNVLPVEHILRNVFGEDGQACSDVNLLCRFL